MKFYSGALDIILLVDKQDEWINLWYSEGLRVKFQKEDLEYV